MAAAAAFLERAADLSPDPARRGRRALAAARLKHDAGALDAAKRLLTVATTSPLDELDLARAERLHAQIAFAGTLGGDTPALLSAAAKRLEPLDPELARETHLEALLAAVRRGRLALDAGVVEAAAAATVPTGEGPARVLDLLLEAVVARLTGGYEPALPTVARALAAFRTEGFRRENLAWWWFACQLAFERWEDDVWEGIASGVVRVARETWGPDHPSPSTQLLGRASSLLRRVRGRGAASGGSGDDPRRNPQALHRLRLRPARRLAGRSGGDL